MLPCNDKAESGQHRFDRELSNNLRNLFIPKCLINTYNHQELLKNDQVCNKQH